MMRLILAMFIWGTVGLFAVWAKIPMVDLSFYRCLFAILPIGLLCHLRGEFDFRWMNLKSISLVILSSVFLVANWLFLFWSFELSSITLGNVSYYLQPIFLVVLGIVFLKNSVSVGQWGLIFLSLIGVLMTAGIFSGKLNLFEGSHVALGFGSAIIAGLLYALVTIIVKPLKEIPSSQLVLWQLTVGAILLAPFVEDFSLAFANQNSLMCLLIIGVVHTGLAYALYYQGVQLVSVTMIAVLSYVDPIVAIFTDVIFFDHQLDLVQIAGILLTLASSYFVVMPRKASKAEPQELAAH